MLDMYRLALAQLLTRHIEVMCVTANPGPWRIVRGTASEVAEDMVRKWKDPVVRVVLTLATLEDQTPKSVIAKSLKIAKRTVDSVWRDTLPNARIVVHVGASTEPETVEIFRRGPERKKSPDGIRLTLRKEQLPWSQLQRIYLGNLPIVKSETEHNAAIDAEIAAHPEKDVADREAAKVAAANVNAVSQLPLIKKTGTDAE
jgi:hypothetical protein